jgi:hypothetical protein
MTCGKSLPVIMRFGTSADDRLFAAAILLAVGILCMTVAAASATVVLLRGSPGGSVAIFSALGLSEPALTPSGSPWRSPGGTPPFVDLRFTPVVPFPEPDPAGLLLRRMRPGIREVPSP